MVKSTTKQLVHADFGDVKIIDKHPGITKSQVLSSHPLSIPRGLHNTSLTTLDEKAAYVAEFVERQKEEGIYPLDRYIETNFGFNAEIAAAPSKTTQDCVVWCTNLYLGLNRRQETIDIVKESLSKHGLGCGTSAVSGGFHRPHIELEQNISTFLGKEDCVLFPTGFSANLGALSALVDKNDYVLFDRDCHSSIIEGLKLSGAPFRSFRHNSVEHLRKMLEKTDFTKYNNVLVVTESVFGMSGLEAPLSEIAALKKEFPFYFYVDEAHSFGLYGPNGEGLSKAQNCLDDVDFFMTTLSKAAGSIGGIIACKKTHGTYIRHVSNAYLFQATLPPTDILTSIESLRVIQTQPELRQRLWNNTAKFRKALKEKGFNVGDSTSANVPVYIEDEVDLAQMCKELFQLGVFTNWVSYPAVKKRTGRLRFNVSAGHTDKQIELTINALEKAGKKIGIV